MIRSSCHPSVVIVGVGEAEGEKDVSRVCAVGTEAQLVSVCVCVCLKEEWIDYYKIEVPPYSFGVR